MSNTKLVVAISDLHCGSDVGLLPELVELSDGQVLGHGKNAWQKWLWQSWLSGKAWLKQLVGDDPFTLVLTGDLIEGFHHRTDEIVAQKLIEHLTIAEASVGDLVKAAEKTYVVRGTECHTHDWESIFAKNFGLGKAHDFIQFDLNGVLVDARHHMPVTGRLHLEASALSIVAANARSNAVRAHHEPARLFLRGHRHLHGIYSDGETMIACTGAWQGLTRHGKKVVTDAVCRPSIVVFDARHSPAGELPSVSQRVFNPPQAICAHVDR